MTEALRRRPTARVLLLDASDRILLQFFSLDGGETGVWITPGGALDEGETFEDAAVRELWEEAGLRDVTLGPCVWERTFVIDLWEGGQMEQYDQYFICRIDSYDISTHVIHDEGERSVTTEQRWWNAEEIAASPDLFAPPEIAGLLPSLLSGDLPLQPIILDR